MPKYQRRRPRIRPHGYDGSSTHRESADLLASSGDSLRLWSLPSQSSCSGGNPITRPFTHVQLPPQPLTHHALLSTYASPEHFAPPSSLDWNVRSPNLIITSSVDTTCTVWDILALAPKQRLIAVFDVRFCCDSLDNFCTCGADGRVRHFDLRTLARSSIIYEPPEEEDKCNSNFPVTPPFFLATDKFSSSIKPGKYESDGCATDHIACSSIAQISWYVLQQRMDKAFGDQYLT